MASSKIGPVVMRLLCGPPRPPAREQLQFISLPACWQGSSAAEATALWEELIASRKKQLAQVVEAGPINLALMSAAQVEVTRQQLASWDASARAWLAVADAAKKREQTQTMLVIKNIMLPVNQKTTVYSSVTEAWTSALISFDKIISGVPCNVTNGAILLALGSWHIYPDMHLLGTDFGLRTCQAVRSFGVCRRHGHTWSLKLLTSGRSGCSLVSATVLSQILRRACQSFEAP